MSDNMLSRSGTYLGVDYTVYGLTESELNIAERSKREDIEAEQIRARNYREFSHFQRTAHWNMTPEERESDFEKEERWR